MLAERSYSAASAYPPVAAQLPATTATEMKRQGWRSVMADVRREGHLLITNHNIPEAVILPPEQYDRLVSAAQQAWLQPDPRLEALRLRFRERMKCLLEEGANEKLGNAMLHPHNSDGRVMAGEAY